MVENLSAAISHSTGTQNTEGKQTTNNISSARTRSKLTTPRTLRKPETLISRTPEKYLLKVLLTDHPALQKISSTPNFLHSKPDKEPLAGQNPEH